MNFFVLSLLSLFTFSSLFAESEIDIQKPHKSQTQKIKESGRRVKDKVKDELKLLYNSAQGIKLVRLLDKGQSEEISPEESAQVLDRIALALRGHVCDLTYRPESVEFEIGIASFEWDTDDLCKDTKEDTNK